ncbi:DNA-directed RNA polymerase specialized sigma subunit, sigma24-like [Lactobacillus acidipiscis] [Dolosigranulum pigrum]|nr:DNA-directed RNA polymerase specialized sigma subunit, sigma24-like [Lactobacillus acidipiscis] [Dolosigranulum pigrum]
MEMEVRITIVDIVVLLLQQTEETIFEALQETCLPVILKRVKACYLRGFEHRDLLQEAYIVLWKILPKYNVRGNIRFRPYFKRCLQNYFNSLIRDQLADKRALNQSIYSLDSIYERVGTELDHGDYADGQPEDQAIARETLARYRTGLSRLEKAVFELMMLDKSYDEMATILGKSQKKVRNACYRCRKKLKKYVHD